MPASVNDTKRTRVQADVISIHAEAPTLIRPQLIERIAAELDRSLVLLCAPAGYGKSTILRLLSDALKDRGQDCVQFDINHETNPAQLDAWLSQSVAKTPERSSRALVIDEYHLIQQPGTDAVLKRFLSRIPRHACLVLAARKAPACAAKLDLVSAAATFDQEDLAFTAAEVSEYFFHHHPAPSDIDGVLAQTEGWPAGVAFAKAWIASAGDIACFSGAAPALAAYFEQEVMHDLPSDLQAALVDTAHLRNIDPDIINAVLRREDGETLLQQLHALTGFVSPIDQRQRRYRRHRLFTDFLQNRRVGNEQRIGLPQNDWAADYFLKSGAPTLAFPYAVASGNVALIETAANHQEFSAIDVASDGSGFTDTMLAVDRLNIGAAPRILPCRALFAIRRGRFDAAKSMLDEAERIATVDDQSQAARRARADRTLIRAIYHFYADNNEADAAAALERSRRKLPHKNPIYTGWLDAVLGAFHARAGRHDDARTALASAATVFTRSDAHGEGVRAAFESAMLELSNGSPLRAAQIIETARRRHSRHLPGDPASAAMIAVAASTIHFECGDLEMADASMAVALDAIFLSGDYWPELLSSAVRAAARVAYAKCGLQAALALLERGADAAEQRRYKRVEKSVLAHRLHLASADGNIALARQAETAINRRFGPMGFSSPPTFGWREDADRAFAHVRFNIACNEPEHALATLDIFDRHYKRTSVPALASKSNTLRALAAFRRGDITEATQAARELVELGEQTGARSFLLEEGTAARILLDETARRYSRSKKSQRDSRTLIEWLILSSSYSPNDQTAGAPVLTQKQLRILHLLAQGLDRKAIAEKSETTVHNVQYHLKTMFDLFGATSSAGLVAEAVRTGVIKKTALSS